MWCWLFGIRGNARHWLLRWFTVVTVASVGVTAATTTFFLIFQSHGLLWGLIAAYVVGAVALGVAAHQLRERGYWAN